MPTDITITRASARVINEELILDAFTERDSEVVNLVAGAPDPESAVHRIMQVGARTLGHAQTTVDTAIVEQAFDGMSRQFESRLEQTIEQFGEITDGLLDDESGALTTALGTFGNQLNELLGKTFDPDDKRSVLALFERILGEANTRQVDAVRRVVDPDDDESPLGRHRTEIIKTVKEMETKFGKQLAELSERFAVQKAQVELIEKTAGKGFTFEELVHTAVSHVAAGHADIAERVGRTPGVAGNHAGDEVVTLCLDDTRGAPARYALELKDRKLGLNATFEELERAMTNRDASVAVAVFSRQEHAPMPGPFHFWGNYGIVVLDKDAVDDGALRLACLWARMTVRRHLSDETSDVDFDRIAALIEEGRRALDRISSIRRYHTQARKCIDQASTQAAEMTVEIESVLDQISDELSR